MKFLKRFSLTIFAIVLLAAISFFLARKLDNSDAARKDFYVSTYDTRTPYLLPSQFISGQRFYIKITTPGGDTMLAVGDSGGGTSMLLPEGQKKQGFRKQVRSALWKGLLLLRYITFSDVCADPHIPPPVPMRDMILRRPFARIKEPLMIVPGTDKEVALMTKSTYMDAFLGQDFFMGKAWTFDYIRQQVWVNTSVPPTEAGSPGVLPIGFKRDADHGLLFGHGSMQVTIDGEIIDVLFDTGATIPLSENGKKALRTSEKSVAASFIIASIFDKWHRKHPEWKYYGKANLLGGDAIEVPVVNIGGYEVGPVLFAKRPETAWSEGMVYSMDKIVKGAIGGSALHYFKVTVDYNSSLIKFER